MYNYILNVDISGTIIEQCKSVDLGRKYLAKLT